MARKYGINTMYCTPKMIWGCIEGYNYNHLAIDNLILHEDPVGLIGFLLSFQFLHGGHHLVSINKYFDKVIVLKEDDSHGKK